MKRSIITSGIGVFLALVVIHAVSAQTALRTILPIQGGTGISTTTAAAGTCLKILSVTSNVPVYTFGTCGSGGGGGSEVNFTYAPNPGGDPLGGFGLVYMSTTTNQLVIGDTASTTANILEIIGRAYLSGGVGIATTTSAGPRLAVTGDMLQAGGGVTFLGPVKAPTFTSTSTTGVNTFPIASTTSFSVGDRLTVSGAGTSTFIGSVTAAGLRSTAGLQVTAGGIHLASAITNTSAATSSFAGGITTAGLNSSLGLSVTGDSIFTGRITSTAGTSSFQGGSFTGLNTSNGLIVSSGGVRLPTVSCDTLDTDANGQIICGTDDGGAGTIDGGGGANQLTYWTDANSIAATSSPTATRFVATSTTAASTFPIASTTSFSIADRLTVSGAGTSTFIGSVTTAGIRTTGGLDVAGGGFSSASALDVSSTGTSTFSGPLVITSSPDTVGTTILFDSTVTNPTARFGFKFNEVSDVFGLLYDASGSGDANKFVFAGLDPATGVGRKDMMTVWGDGSVSIGTTTRAWGRVGIDGLLVTNNILATSTTAFSGIGTSTLNSGYQLNVGGTILSGSGTSTNTGNNQINGNLYVKGGLQLPGLSECVDTTDKVVFAGGSFGCGTDETAAGGSVTGTGGTNMLSYWTSGTNIAATSSPTATIFTATSTTAASTFPIASTTSFSIADRLTVAGIGTSTFTGGILGGGLGIGTSSPSGLYLAGFGNQILFGSPTATSTNIGALDNRGHLRVNSLEILGSCKGCPAGGGGSSSGASGVVQLSDGASGFTSLAGTIINPTTFEMQFATATTFTIGQVPNWFSQATTTNLPGQTTAGTFNDKEYRVSSPVAIGTSTPPYEVGFLDSLTLVGHINRNGWREMNCANPGSGTTVNSSALDTANVWCGQWYLDVGADGFMTYGTSSPGYSRLLAGNASPTSGDSVGLSSGSPIAGAFPAAFKNGGFITASSSARFYGEFRMPNNVQGIDAAYSSGKYMFGFATPEDTFTPATEPTSIGSATYFHLDNAGMIETVTVNRGIVTRFAAQCDGANVDLRSANFLPMEIRLASSSVMFLIGNCLAAQHTTTTPQAEMAPFIQVNVNAGANERAMLDVSNIGYSWNGWSTRY